MTSLDVIRRLHEHREWSNERLLQAAEELTDEELRRPFDIGQGSVWRSLMHMLGAEFVWIEALTGNPRGLMPGDAPGKLPGNQVAGGGPTTVAELRAAWTPVTARWRDYLAGLTESSFVEPVYRARVIDGVERQFATSRSDVLLHVCTHAHYTGAQAVNLLRHLGRPSLPDLMLITLARGQTVGNDPRSGKK
jgi:uncharacterized damage-inducible protein DinB